MDFCLYNTVTMGSEDDGMILVSMIVRLCLVLFNLFQFLCLGCFYFRVSFSFLVFWWFLLCAALHVPCFCFALLWASLLFVAFCFCKKKKMVEELCVR